MVHTVSDLEIIPRAPFSLLSTVRALQRRPGSRSDVFEDGSYHRVLPSASGLRRVSVADAGSVEQPKLRLAIAGGDLAPVEAARLLTTIGEMLGVAVDLSQFYAIAAEDTQLAHVVAALRGLKPPRFPTLFESLVNSVSFQQISLAAAVAIVGRLVERFGRPLVVDERRYFAFPEPEAIAAASVEELRAAGLTARKATVLRHLAAVVIAGELSFDQLRLLPSEEAIRVLTALPGIGRWTAEVVLLRGLGRLDVFPTGDVGARRGVARLLGQDQPLTAAEERSLVERFGTVCGCLYFYSLGWSLARKGLL